MQSVNPYPCGSEAETLYCRCVIIRVSGVSLYLIYRRWK